MDQFLAATVAEDLLDVPAVVANDPACISGVVGAETPGHLVTLEVPQNDGIAALEALFRRGCARPDLVISDFQLSASETGDAAIARACELWQSELPAFIVSGAETAELWQTIAATGYPALRKPVKPARLRAMINHLMR